MLGDQLIKNEFIALVEIIKNSYDADATWVKVEFVDFGEDFSQTPSSKIIIEDNGFGMNRDILEHHWLNPATPVKLKKKKDNPRTPKGRIIQGEKGIGRFSVFKLGNDITVTTRRQKQKSNGEFINEGEEFEYVLKYDFSKYDNDFLFENGKEKELFLDDISVEFDERKPKTIVQKDILLGLIKQVRPDYGTRIEISGLKSGWTKDKIERVQIEVGKLLPIFSDEENADFSVCIYKDGLLSDSFTSYRANIKHLLENKSLFKITNGYFDCPKNTISYDINGESKVLNFSDAEIIGLSSFKQFKERISKGEILECGSFGFEFYIFDFSADSKNITKYFLSKEEREIIKQHRIYLYRDGVRVMPYGDPEDDWIGIDMKRGTVRAADYLSNDQVVGCVYISQECNPNLKDKTNREGLVEVGLSLDDFTGVLQLIIQYLRKKPYAQYVIEKNRKKEGKLAKSESSHEWINKFKEECADEKRIQDFLVRFEKIYEKEQSIYPERIRKTEDLAAVGLSVETAAHDMMILLNRAKEGQDSIIKEVSAAAEIDKLILENKLKYVKDAIDSTYLWMKDIQVLFPSTKSRTRIIDVSSIIKKVHNIYRRLLEDNSIKVFVHSTDEAVLAKTTGAVLLQVFINLFDNAVYWLKTVDREREIQIIINGKENTVTFSDNGPGVKLEDADYIFEPFYSGKGIEGRGLGLYIARQLLDRYGASIDLILPKASNSVEGALFKLTFQKVEEMKNESK